MKKNRVLQNLHSFLTGRGKLNFKRLALSCYLFLLFMQVPLFSQPPSEVQCAGEDVTNCLNYPFLNYQCVDANYIASNLFGNQLLAPNDALNIPQYIIVKGFITFTTDYTFTQGSEIVFVDNNSGFIIKNGKTLTLDGCALHGCDKLWAGVIVEGIGTPNTLIAKNCTFEDAKVAITLRDKAIFQITGCTFRKNLCGILAKTHEQSPNPSTTISLTPYNALGISGNTFYGDEQLLEAAVPSDIDMTGGANPPSTPTNYPCFGIWLEQVNSLSIGWLKKHTKPKDGTSNIFLSFGQNSEPGVRTQGIRSILSNVKIVNAVFQYFGRLDNGINIRSDAIFAWNNQFSAITTTEFRGMNAIYEDPAESFSFSYCYNDIRTVGTHLSATEYTSNNAIFSIEGAPFPFSTIGGTQPPISYKIKDNVINNFRFRGIRIGAHKNGDINIEGNKVSDTDDPQEILSPRIGILLERVIMGPLDLPGASIRNNTIRSSSMFPMGVFWGIALRTVSSVTVANNFISDDLPETNLTNFQGIKIFQPPCDGLDIAYNQISGAKIDYPNEGIGIYIEESVDCAINCNTVDNTNTGMQFNRMCDMPNNLSRNNFKHHAIGLQLGDPLNPTSSIGEQTSMENRWLGADSQVEAMSINLASAQSSIFSVNSSDQGSEYWPSPRKIGSDDDNQQWFITLPNQEPTYDYACYPRRPKLSDSDKKLLNGTYTSPFGYPALDWEAKWKFANRFNSDQELLNLTSDVIQYYEGSYDETYSRLSRAYQAYINCWSTTPAIDELTAKQAAAIEARFALESQLSEESNTTLYEQMLDLDASIVTIAAAFSTASEAWAENISQSMANLLEEVENIPCTEEYEEDMRSVLSILIRSHITGGTPMESEVEQMKKIANKCRYSGGYAVVLARSCFEPSETKEQDLACQSEERELTRGVALEGNITLSPNPAGRSVTLDIGKSFGQATVRFFNGQGGLVMERIVTEQLTTVPLEGLSSGIYHVVVSFDGAILAHKTFLKH